MNQQVGISMVQSMEPTAATDISTAVLTINSPHTSRLVHMVEVAGDIAMVVILWEMITAVSIGRNYSLLIKTLKQQFNWIRVMGNSLVWGHILHKSIAILVFKYLFERLYAQRLCNIYWHKIKHVFWTFCKLKWLLRKFFLSAGGVKNSFWYLVHSYCTFYSYTSIFVSNSLDLRVNYYLFKNHKISKRPESLMIVQLLDNDFSLI